MDAALRTFAEEGADYVTLGLAPLSRRAGVPDERPFPGLRLILAWIRAHGRRFYNFDGLDAFKAKFKPDAWEPLSGRAFVYFNRKQWESAIADFSKAIVLAPQVHTNWWHRGHAYLNLAQWDKAAADFGKVVERWPDGSEGWYLRAVAFAQLKQPDKARADLRQAIAKGFNNLEWLKNDSRLAPLRSREDFGQLLEELERKGK